MKRIMFIGFVSLLFISLSVSAGNSPAPAPAPKAEVHSHTVALKGLVCDKQTQETLAGVVIIANGQKIYTDLDGNFTIPNTGTEKCKIKVSLISYEDQTVEIDASNSGNIQIKLQQL
jgi:hypothetical protein